MEGVMRGRSHNGAENEWRFTAPNAGAPSRGEGRPQTTANGPTVLTLCRPTRTEGTATLP
jgi:hypothetical protein